MEPDERIIQLGNIVINIQFDMYYKGVNHMYVRTLHINVVIIIQLRNSRIHNSLSLSYLLIIIINIFIIINIQFDMYKMYI